MEPSCNTRYCPALPLRCNHLGTSDPPALDTRTQSSRLPHPRWHPRRCSRMTPCPHPPDHKREREGVLNNLVQTTQTAKNHGRKPPHTSPPRTPTYDPPPAETATACTTGAANATGGGRASAAPEPLQNSRSILCSQQKLLQVSTNPPILSRGGYRRSPFRPGCALHHGE